MSGMSISGKQLKRLHAALLESYREKDDLKIFLNYELGIPLDAISWDKSLNKIVFDIIEFTNSVSSLFELVSAAAKERPNNLEFRKLLKELTEIDVIEKSTSEHLEKIHLEPQKRAEIINKSTYSLGIDFNYDGEPIQDDLELLARSSETILAIESDIDIDIIVNFEKIEFLNQTINKIDMEKPLSAQNRITRVHLIRQRNQNLIKLERFRTQAKFIMSPPIFNHIRDPIKFRSVLKGLGHIIFSNNQPSENWKDYIVLDIYLVDNPRIYTITYIRIDSDEENNNYFRFLGGGWDLFDLPNLTRYEFAIPAIVNEYFWQLEKGKDLEELKIMLNIYKWRVGLR